MNFGFRLPGPFRASVSSKGHVNAGATLGPVSISKSIGGGRRGLLLPLTLDQFVQQAQAEGFKVTVTPGTSATIERRWTAAVATVVPGRGLVLRRTASTRQILTVIAAAATVLLVCCGPSFWSAAQR